MIDNYDSFTYNLVHYFESLGQQVLVARNNEISIEQITKLQPDYLVISPGPCDPNSAGISLQAISAFAHKMPILGVCLGHQCIAQQFGASVIRAKKVMHGKTSNISHNNQNLFQQLPNPLTVTRYHSLLIAPNTLPDCFTIDAWFENEQGETEIMAISHKTLPIYGVQFHPESVLTECGHQLLNNFLTLGKQKH